MARKKPTLIIFDPAKASSEDLDDSAARLREAAGVPGTVRRSADKDRVGAENFIRHLRSS